MADYSQWLRRAELFARATHRLPGRWSMKILIEPPLEAAEVEGLERVLANGLPKILKDFFLTASRSARCHYSWYELSKLARQDIPIKPPIYGGVDFCSAAKMEDHQKGIFYFAELMEEYGNDLSIPALIRNCVPLMAVGNGDMSRSTPRRPSLSRKSFT